VFFFFSSRSRHTIFSRDWSSDVCSSDLAARRGIYIGKDVVLMPSNVYIGGHQNDILADISATPGGSGRYYAETALGEILRRVVRSEERRVGEEGGARWGRDDWKKTEKDR